MSFATAEPIQLGEGRAEVLIQLVEAAGTPAWGAWARITSYNVCYTKLLRALRTITLGAAYTLRLDREIGSIECGKHADFAVLDDDPLEAGGEALKDVRVWGTVQGGRVFEAATL